MAAQKRSAEHLEEETQQRNHQQQQQQEAEGGEDSDGSPSSSSGEKDEFILVKLSEIRKEVQCPICLGIIRKTRTVMECLHRFCRECIDKSMRMGNNECPACRTHCASRRSLRDDPNYDALISALYPDIDKYEEEELAFHEEEKTRNKQIQAAIAQTLRRQSEALSRRRTTAKDTATAFARKSHCSYQNLRGRRNCRANELQGSDNDEDSNGNGGKDASSAEECAADFKQKRFRRWGGHRFSHPSAAANADGGCDENDVEVNKENSGSIPGRVGSPEGLVWGRGGTRSHTRYGSVTGSNGKNSRSNRLSKLVDHLRSLDENDNELDIDLVLISLDGQSLPSLKRPYLCCHPPLSIRHLCQIQMPVEEVEVLVVKEPRHKTAEQSGSALDPASSIDDTVSMPLLFDTCKDELQILEEQETLAGIQSNYASRQGHLILVYRQKLKS